MWTHTIHMGTHKTYTYTINKPIYNTYPRKQYRCTQQYTCTAATHIHTCEHTTHIHIHKIHVHSQSTFTLTVYMFIQYTCIHTHPHIQTLFSGDGYTDKGTCAGVFIYVDVETWLGGHADNLWCKPLILPDQCDSCNMLWVSSHTLSAGS